MGWPCTPVSLKDIKRIFYYDPKVLGDIPGVTDNYFLDGSLFGAIIACGRGFFTPKFSQVTNNGWQDKALTLGDSRVSIGTTPLDLSAQVDFFTPTQAFFLDSIKCNCYSYSAVLILNSGLVMGLRTLNGVIDKSTPAVDGDFVGVLGFPISPKSINSLFTLATNTTQDYVTINIQALDEPVYTYSDFLISNPSPAVTSYDTFPVFMDAVAGTLDHATKQGTLTANLGSFNLDIDLDNEKLAGSFGYIQLEGTPITIDILNTYTWDIVNNVLSCTFTCTNNSFPPNGTYKVKNMVILSAVKTGIYYKVYTAGNFVIS